MIFVLSVLLVFSASSQNDDQSFSLTGTWSTTSDMVQISEDVVTRLTNSEVTYFSDGEWIGQGSVSIAPIGREGTWLEFQFRVDGDWILEGYVLREGIENVVFVPINGDPIAYEMADYLERQFANTPRTVSVIHLLDADNIIIRNQQTNEIYNYTRN